MDDICISGVHFVVPTWKELHTNFQNLPRQEKVVKGAFVPKLDALMFFDYKQIEPRLLAYYLHELGFPRFAEFIRSGADPYTAIGMGYFGKSELTDAERQLAKQTLLSLMYGGGLPAIKRYFSDLDWAGAKKVVNQFYRAWPEVRVLAQKIEQRVDERGYITTLFGRHLHPDPKLGRDNALRKMLNALIQGCAADLMRYSLVKTDEELERMRAEAHLVCVIHDELVIDAPLDEVEELVHKVPTWMDYGPVSQVVPVLADVEWSTTTWAAKQPYEEASLVRDRSH